MYIIIVKENDNDAQFRSELIFRFETLDEAIKFMNNILVISNYRIEIIPPEEN